ncbi:MAG: flagellar M-ring protein FliF [Granulosicoccus sp.]|nr:flagellar M-ring protein FliF [Granulosicoccus sp.]
MSEAVTVNDAAPATPLLSTVARGLAAPQFGALLIVSTALTLGIGLIFWTMQPQFVPVSQQGGREDTLQIIDLLAQRNVDFKIDPTSGLVLVPSDQATSIQLTLAASGIETGGQAVGLELLQQEPSLGTSHFTESARYQHALETELSRTIASMRNVDSARVHLAIPKQSVFVRDREQASASVMIKPMPGRSVEDEQVNSVINLVASSIPYLESGQVTVVDQWGRLLSTGDNSTSGATRDQYQYARKLEKLYAERIESLLTPIVGPGRVRAMVTADVDFTLNEQTQELFDPDAAQLRSEQIDTEVNRNTGAGGVPGALTNQPPADGEVDPEGNPADAEQTTNESSSEVKNYELDKTIRHVRQMPGTIIRLSAAVIIDNKPGVDADGNPISTPLADEELAEYTQIAQEAIGFDQDRGDSVVVFNRGFQPVEEVVPMDPLPIWEQTWLWTMVRQVLVGLSVLLLVLMVLRPAAKRLVPPRQANLLPAAIDDENNPNALDSDASQNSLAASQKNSNALEPPPVVYGDILNMARAMAAEDPKRVAKVVKDWVASP